MFGVPLTKAPSNNTEKGLYYGRVDLDGAPFRGSPPHYKEEEYVQRVAKVADVKNGFFDVRDPEQNKAYLAVLEACANGWYDCLWLQRFVDGTSHYVEWVEYYMEDQSSHVS